MITIDYNKIYTKNKVTYQSLAYNMHSGDKKAKLLNAMSKDLTKVIKEELNNKKQKRRKISRNVIVKENTKNVDYSNTIFREKFDLPEITLTGKYLQKYND